MTRDEIEADRLRYGVKTLLVSKGGNVTWQWGLPEELMEDIAAGWMGEGEWLLASGEPGESTLYARAGLLCEHGECWSYKSSEWDIPPPIPQWTSNE